MVNIFNYERLIVFLYDIEERYSSYDNCINLIGWITHKY
jgi:hypothetical protein